MTNFNQTRKKPREMNFPEFCFKIFIVFSIAVMIVAACIYLTNVAVQHVNKMERQKKAEPVVSNSDYLLQ